MLDTLLQGDALERLRELPDASVQCCVTSPPYWGLRDYGVAGQIGLEAAPDEWLQRLVAIFAEVRRVLRADGTLWLNVGDAYAHGGNGARDPERWPKQSRNAHGFRTTHAKDLCPGLKPKDLIGLPWMLAFALRADGWWLRSDIIWHKPNPMPESVIDRPSRAHEYIFLLSKSARYYYDAEAVRTPLREKTRTTWGTEHHSKGTDALGNVKAHNWAITMSERRPRLKVPAGWDVAPGAHGAFHREGRGRPDKQRGHVRRHAGFNDRWDQMTKGEQQEAGANLRDVWTVATRPFLDAHFATFPPALIEPCIMASTRSGDVVLDPFVGTGTVPVVAKTYGRHYHGIDINPAYLAMAERRVAAVEQPALLYSPKVVRA